MKYCTVCGTKLKKRLPTHMTNYKFFENFDKNTGKPIMIEYCPNLICDTNDHSVNKSRGFLGFQIGCDDGGYPE